MLSNKKGAIALFNKKTGVNSFQIECKSFLITLNKKYLEF